MSDGTTVTEDTDGEATDAPADVTEATTDTTTTKASTIVDGEASSKDGIGPSGWGDDWRKGLTQDEALLKRLDRFDSPVGVLDWAVNAEKKLKENAPRTTLTRPDADASEEDVAAWREAAGVPETADKYDIQLSDGMQLGEADKPVAESFMKEAHEAGMPNEYVSKAIDWYLRQERSTQEGMLDDDNGFYARSEQELRDDWGPTDYKTNIGAIRGIFNNASEEVSIEGEEGKISIEEAILGARMPNGRKVGADPATLRFLARIGREILPIGAEVPDGTTRGDLTDRLEEIRKIRRTDPGEYERNKPLQAEELKLIDAKLRRERRSAA